MSVQPPSQCWRTGIGPRGPLPVRSSCTFYLLLPTKLECLQIPPPCTSWHKGKKPAGNWQGDGWQWGGDDPLYWVQPSGAKLILIMIGIKEAHDKQYSSYHNRRHLLIEKWLWQLNTVSFPKWWGAYDSAFQVFGKYKLLCSFVLIRVTFKRIFSFQGLFAKRFFELQNTENTCIFSQRNASI